MPTFENMEKLHEAAQALVTQARETYPRAQDEPLRSVCEAHVHMAVSETETAK